DCEAALLNLGQGQTTRCKRSANDLVVVLSVDDEPVLSVDDEAVNQQVLHALLWDSGYQLVT
ncbi:hypothetical protein HaLaN_02988, partial [Haematococcus lacustris]